jgi:FkbM family methyltransferase
MYLSRASLFEELMRARDQHSRESAWWQQCNSSLVRDERELRTCLEEGSVCLGPLGDLPFSYREMGQVTSVDLFGLDELIIFSFYWSTRGLYRKVVDMGANIGLHSVVLGRMGFEVYAYEPDPIHMEQLRRHVEDAGLGSRVTMQEAAVGAMAGPTEFVRVLGNTTGSHVAGAKPQPYGLLERFQVLAVPIADASRDADLVKMDVEGLEGDLLTHMSPRAYQRMDLLCEVGSAENANRIWAHYLNTEVNLFPQKLGWRRATQRSDLPTSYKEGSLFISVRSAMPWGGAQERRYV